MMLKGMLRLGLATVGACALAARIAGAASHREAPLMTLDPAADITDVYAFVSYDAANLARAAADRRVTLVMNVIPGQEPGSGPNYFSFDDNVLYQFHVDNNRDGDADDVLYQVRFETQVTSPTQFVFPVAGGPLPPVTALEGDGAAGLASIQRYSITELRGCKAGRKGPKKCAQKTVLFGGALRPTVPSNVGPRTMPDYEALAAQGVFTDGASGIRVFAGQRAETFAIDLGAVFDTVNLRVENATPIMGARPPLPIQTAAEDADDTQNPFGTNTFSGFNVSTIALEIPASRLTADGQGPTATNGTIGVYATTSRQRLTMRRGEPTLNPRKPPKALLSGAKEFVQVSRMGNPLVNELIIPFGRKDLWNATDAEDESIFLDAYRNLAVGAALQAVAGMAVQVPAPPREDVVRLLLKYGDQDPSASVGPFVDLLRLDMTVPPTAPASIQRLGPFAHTAADTAAPDPAGFPNGRRPNDDVTDLVVRVAGGPDFVTFHVGDGVGISEKGITPDFPFLPTPYDGRNRRHRDPGETS